MTLPLVLIPSTALLCYSVPFRHPFEQLQPTCRTSCFGLLACFVNFYLLYSQIPVYEFVDKHSGFAAFYVHENEAGRYVLSECAKRARS